MNRLLRKVLESLQENPALCRAVALELSCHSGNDSEINLQTLVKAMSPLLTKIGEQLDRLQDKVAALEVAERLRLQQVCYLAAWPHHDVRPNGHGRY